MNPLLVRVTARLLMIFGLAVTSFTSVFAQPTVNLQASLVPAISISGPPNSLQELQYTTNLADSNSWHTLSFVRLDAVPKNYFDFAATGSKRFYRTRLSGFADTNLVWIPPGTFLMGSPDTEEGRNTNEGPQTQVTFTYGFFMSRFELSNYEYILYEPDFVSVDHTKTNYMSLPARGVTWNNATNYCALRTAAEQALGLIPPGWAYRLPSEAEWEYACRAGTTTVFATGDTLRNDAVSQDAWFDGTHPYPTNLPPVDPISSTSVTFPGRFAPNNFGLYDVHGNLAEWCLDLFDTSDLTPPTGYPGGSITNPPPATSTSSQASAAVRGGAFLALNTGTLCRSAARATRVAFSFVVSSVGFRVILAPVNP